MMPSWLIFVPRLVILLLLIMITFLDWKTQANLQRIIQSKDRQIAALQSYESYDVLKFHLEAALKQIRQFNGNHAVVLPNPDGTTYVDQLDPGESVIFEIPIDPIPPDKLGAR